MVANSAAGNAIVDQAGGGLLKLLSLAKRPYGTQAICKTVRWTCGSGECHGIGGDGDVSGRRNGMVGPITTAHFGRDESGVASDEGTGLRGLLLLVSVMKSADPGQVDDFCVRGGSL
jgi:hypothetical protein